MQEEIPAYDSSKGIGMASEMNPESSSEMSYNPDGMDMGMEKWEGLFMTNDEK